MMLDDFNHFCSQLPSTSHVVQWGGADVWKIGGKVFALAREAEDRQLTVSFKCSPLAFQMLSEQPGTRPAPYLASRGMKWIQYYSNQSMDDATLRDYVVESYRLVMAGLPKRLQSELNRRQEQGACPGQGG